MSTNNGGKCNYASKLGLLMQDDSMMRAIEDTLRDQDAVPRQFSSHRAIEASLALVLKPYRDDPIVGKFITALTRGAIAADKRPAPVVGASAPAPSGIAAPMRPPAHATRTSRQQRPCPLDEPEESAPPVSMTRAKRRGAQSTPPRCPEALTSPSWLSG